MTQVTLIDDGHAAQLERERDFEVDYTPGPVVRQGLTWLANYCAADGHQPMTMLDPCAGAGVFGQQATRVFGTDIYSLGIEPREEERENIVRNYSLFATMTAEAYAMRFGQRPDITATNPPFSLWPEILRLYLPRSRWVMLYGTISWGCSDAGAEIFRNTPPFACARVVGRVHHRGPGLNPETGKPWGADQRDVCWWLFRHGNTHPAWATENLAPLPADERRWIVKPGTEVT